MNGDSSFVDLRLNQQAGAVNESFWPSFTDIMTVIVMIFLIAMVILLMRNMELLTELRVTMEAERAASELARATGEEKATLSSQLHAAQDRLSQLRMQMMRLHERNLAQGKTIAEQRTRISDLVSKRNTLTQQNTQLSLARDALEVDLENTRTRLQGAEQDLTKLRANVASLEHNLATVQDRFTGAQENIRDLQQQLADQQTQLAASQRTNQDIDRKYQTLVGEYDELHDAYQELIRPARSPEGRQLVEVRYWKQDGAYRIAFREGGVGPFQAISRERLDQRLSELREGAKNGLYVKIIFPEHSGLSYNEAFSFTSHLHSNYDYYFQDKKDQATKTPDAPQ